jgi:hypothetical protein
MKLIVLAVLALGVAAPSKPVQLAIVHAVRGCHVWHTTRDSGPATAVKLHRGGRITIRVSCPMDFTLAQLRGPALALGDPVLHTGTQRTLTFKKRGHYVLQGTETMTSEQMGLQTLGPDNVLRLTVDVS